MTDSDQRDQLTKTVPNSPRPLGQVEPLSRDKQRQSYLSQLVKLNLNSPLPPIYRNPTPCWLVFLSPPPQYDAIFRVGPLRVTLHTARKGAQPQTLDIEQWVCPISTLTLTWPEPADTLGTDDLSSRPVGRITSLPLHPGFHPGLPGTASCLIPGAFSLPPRESPGCLPVVALAAIPRELHGRSSWLPGCHLVQTPTATSSNADLRFGGIISPGVYNPHKPSRERGKPR